MVKIKNFQEILAEVKNLVGNNSRIAYVEEIISNKNELSRDIIAESYEMLAELYENSERFSGEIYKKAASEWEMIGISINREDASDGHRIDILKRAFRNYGKAYNAYRSMNNESSATEINARMMKLKDELRSNFGPFKTFSIAVVMLGFIISFFFLSSSFTGFVAAPFETEETTILGIVFVLLAIIGSFFVIKYL